jgi:transposase-like protein
MTKGVRRRYGRALKLEIVRRMAAGESAVALAREYGIGRTNNLYRWWHEVRVGGEGALRDGAGRPSWLEQQPKSSEVGDLAGARRRIAELERKVGQQQVDLDFFEGALRRIEASRRPDDGPGGTKSSPRSRR